MDFGTQKKPCRKCLIADMNPDEILNGIAEYIRAVPADKRVDEETYQKRLSVCKSCAELSNGMCAKCACFVELRALKPHMYCASEKKLW